MLIGIRLTGVAIDVNFLDLGVGKRRAKTKK